MNGRGVGPDLWFDASTEGAPDALRTRANKYFTAAHSADIGARLADAGQMALGAAIAAGARRAAALDLLAADALITLALLAHSERDPGTLAARAMALRVQVSVTS